jgi:thiol-disulfide isomerase/thioredoxin
LKRAHAIALFAAVALAAAGGGAAYHLWLSGGDSGAGSAAIAERLYSTRLPDTTGDSQPLEQWRGRVLVVNFWATWCAPCREEIPGFVRLQERHGRQGLQFVGIAIDQPGKVADFAREFGINYPLLIGGTESLDLLRQAGNRQAVLPYTVVIDRQGRVASRQPGGLKEDRLEALVKPLF